MKRLAAFLCMAALALPGCGGSSPKPSGPASARPAASTSARGLDQAAREQDRAKPASTESEAILSREEGHPFWNVVGAGLGLAGSLLVVALVLGGF